MRLVGVTHRRSFPFSNSIETEWGREGMHESFFSREPVKPRLGVASQG
jgi:hypothetical protein